MNNIILKGTVKGFYFDKRFGEHFIIVEDYFSKTLTASIYNASEVEGKHFIGKEAFIVMDTITNSILKLEESTTENERLFAGIKNV